MFDISIIEKRKPQEKYTKIIQSKTFHDVTYFLFYIYIYICIMYLYGI